MKNTFFDAYLREGENPIICYRSGLTTYEEGLVNGVYMPLGWNVAGFTLNVLEDFPTYFKIDEYFKPEAFSFDVNGETFRDGFKFESFNKTVSENGLVAIVKLSHESGNFNVYVITALDGTAIITRHIEIENLTNAPLKLGNIAVMSGPMHQTKNWHKFINQEDEYKLYSLGYFERSYHLYEGSFAWHDMTPVKQTISSRYDYNRFRHPMFMLKNNADGAIFFAQLGYSGGYAFDFVYNSEYANNMASVAFSSRIDGDNPTYILQEKETFVSPKLHIGAMNGDLDDIVNEMHDHTRKSVFTLPFAKNTKGGVLAGGMGPERTMSVSNSKHFADTFEKLGVETFIVDAGWYCPPGLATKEWWRRVGEWNYDTDLYPNGIEEIRDYFHSKGLLFGMWAEVERAGVASKVYENHPDWYIYHNGERTTILDVSNPKVVEFIENSICHLVDDYKIDLFRLDYNVSIKHMHYKNANGENGIYRYYENLYAMFKRLRLKYPEVVFENCASGGARTDLGMLENFSHTWVTDHQVAPRSVSITNGMTMVLPPEYVDRLASGMGSHEIGALDLVIRQTLFGKPTTNSYNSLGSDYNTNQIEFVKHSYDIYKNIIRPFADTGKVYHHTPELFGKESKGYCVLERSSNDKLTSVIGVFRLVGDNENSITVYPKGISVSNSYKVTFDNDDESVIISGYEIKNNGIKINISNNLSSELIILQKA